MLFNAYQRRKAYSILHGHLNLLLEDLKMTSLSSVFPTMSPRRSHDGPTKYVPETKIIESLSGKFGQAETVELLNIHVSHWWNIPNNNNIIFIGQKTSKIGIYCDELVEPTYIYGLEIVREGYNA